MSEKVTLAIAAGVDFQGKDEDRTKPPEPVCRQTQINFYFIFWSSEQFGEPSPFTLVQFHTPLPFFLFFFFNFFLPGAACRLFCPLLRVHGRPCGKHIFFSKQTLPKCSPHYSVFQDALLVPKSGTIWPFVPCGARSQNPHFSNGKHNCGAWGRWIQGWMWCNHLFLWGCG